jgi:hypothetical protein
MNDDCSDAGLTTADGRYPPLNISLRVTAGADEQIVGSSLQTEVGVGIAQCLQGRSDNFGAAPGESQQLVTCPTHSLWHAPR